MKFRSKEKNSILLPLILVSDVSPGGVGLNSIWSRKRGRRGGRRLLQVGAVEVLIGSQQEDAVCLSDRRGWIGKKALNHRS